MDHNGIMFIVLSVHINYNNILNDDKTKTRDSHRVINLINDVKIINTRIYFLRVYSK